MAQSPAWKDEKCVVSLIVLLRTELQLQASVATLICLYEREGRGRVRETRTRGGDENAWG